MARPRQAWQSPAVAAVAAGPHQGQPQGNLEIHRGSGADRASVAAAALPPPPASYPELQQASARQSSPLIGTALPSAACGSFVAWHEGERDHLGQHSARAGQQVCQTVIGQPSSQRSTSKHSASWSHSSAPFPHQHHCSKSPQHQLAAVRQHCAHCLSNGHVHLYLLGGPASPEVHGQGLPARISPQLGHNPAQQQRPLLCGAIPQPRWAAWQLKLPSDHHKCL